MSRSTSAGSTRSTRGPLRYAGSCPAAIRRRSVRMLRPVRSAASARDSNWRRRVEEVVIPPRRSGRASGGHARHERSLRGHRPPGGPMADRSKSRPVPLRPRAPVSHANRVAAARFTSPPASRAGSLWPIGYDSSPQTGTVSRAVVLPKPLPLLRTQQERR